MFGNETICAVATGMGRSAIGIVRVSGPEAISICDSIFEGKKKISEMESFTAAFGTIVDRSESKASSEGEAAIDEAIVLVMKAPHTYTTEDTVEIDVHGGPFVIKKVLELLVKLGARIAEPGEFTKRAFLGGRIDMTEAEAVMDVISAETDRALSTSISQLTGMLRGEILGLRERILYQTAYIESALDDPENYSLDGFSEKLMVEVTDIRARIDKLLSTAEEGRVIREGISTAIVGRPNVGKSSMLNRLLGEERAIVTEVEGTTRDTLEEYIDIGGILLKLIDTAGIHTTEDIVERIGVDKARQSIESADLVLMLLDGADELTEEDRTICSFMNSKRVIVLINKVDKLESGADGDTAGLTNIDEDELSKHLTEAGTTDWKIIHVSAKTGQGIDELKELIRDMFFKNELDYNDQIYITRERHKALLLSAEESLQRVEQSISDGAPEDFMTIDLMAAYETLGEIIGETLEDDLADKIFSEFCMGK